MKRLQKAIATMLKLAVTETWKKMFMWKISTKMKIRTKLTF
jgi:hypothetical protein